MVFNISVFHKTLPKGKSCSVSAAELLQACMVISIITEARQKEWKESRGEQEERKREREKE